MHVKNGSEDPPLQAERKLSEIERFERRNSE
jgi:hypothetical protein